MSTRKRTDTQIIKAIRDARGLIAVAARKLDVDRQTIYNRMKQSAKVRDAVEEARDFTTDVAEAKLFQAIEAGEAWAVCFYLKCQAKGRGYVEKQQVEHTGKDGGPIETRALSDDELVKRLDATRNRLAKFSPSEN